MRKLLLLAATVTMVTGAGIVTASATDYPFCIKGRDYPPGVGQCIFPSYAACQSFASGQYAYCDINPFYHSASQNPQPRKSRRSSQSTY